MTNSKPSKLKRGIGRWDLTAFIVNGIIGAGIFGMPSKIFALTGMYSIAALVICSFIVLLFILVMSEISSRFTTTGGPYLYARKAFGPFVGFEMGWFMWLARIMGFSAICNLLLTYAAFFIPVVGTPPGRILSIFLIVGFLMTVNYVGVKTTARVSNFLIVAKLIPLFLFVGVGFFFIEPTQFAMTALPEAGNISKTLIYLIFVFSGFEVATIYAGEVINPKKNFPLAFFTALSFVTVVYICIQVVSIGTLPDLQASKKPLADAARLFMGQPGGVIISLGAVVSMMGTLNATLLACSRLPFAMAEENQLPAKIGAIHKKFQTPHVAIIISGCVILISTISYSFIQAVTITVIIKLTTFAVICISLPVFRRSKEVSPAKFVAPWGVGVAMISLMVCLWLVSSVSLKDLLHIVVAAVMGLIFYLIFKKKQQI